MAGRFLQYALLSLVLAVLPSPGCASRDRSPAPTDTAGLLALLPALPREHPGLRVPNAVHSVTFDGADEEFTRGGMDSGTAHLLPSAAGEVSFAMYRFAAGGEEPVSIDVDFTVDGSQAFLAVADYGAGQWDISGPFNADGPEQALGTGNLSPGDNVWCVVLSCDGTDVVINGGAVELDGPELTPIFVTGHISDGGAPLAGVTLLVPFPLDGGGLTATTDANGNYAFQGLAANSDFRIIPTLAGFSFDPPLILLDLQTNATGQDFTATAQTLPAVVNYTQHMRPQVFEPICMNCHSSTLAGADRHGAPVSVNWDTYGGTTPTQKNSGTTRANSGSMPPPAFGPDPDFNLNSFQKQLFTAWRDGGFVEN